MLSFKEFLIEKECPIRNRPVTQQELKQLENYLDKVFASLGIDVAFTRHFVERINDSRNKQQISICELEKLYIDVYKKYGRALSSSLGKSDDEIEGVLKDISTQLNVPFVLKFDRRSRDLILLGKTIMRKKDFYIGKNDKKIVV